MDFSEKYLLPRAGKYTNHLNAEDCLPLPYGDLTDGQVGNWELPCIDTAAFVYAYAGFDVLSVAEGNVINIYADGILVNPADYTFDESNNFESLGNIATITFDSDQANARISARGKGHDASGVLITNAIDIINDFLINVSGSGFVAGDWNIAKKALAYSKFSSLGYSAAGVIAEDTTYWSIIQKLVTSFWGKVWLDNNKKLSIVFDTGTISEYAQLARLHNGGDIEIIDTDARCMQDIINRCPVRYRYSWYGERWKNITDDDSAVDTTSQTKYGTRRPAEGYYDLWWCRDKTIAQAIQALVIARYKEPPWTLNIKDRSFKRCRAEKYDTISLSVPWLYTNNHEPYINQIFEIIAITPRLMGSQKGFDFKVRDTGKFLTVQYLADGTYKADGSIKAGGERDLTTY